MKFFIYFAIIVGLTIARPQPDEEEAEVDSEEQTHAEPNKKTTTCACGWTNKARIVGGKETLKNEYPLIGSLVRMSNNFVFSGASILTVHHALTAAHSTVEFKNEPLGLMVGHHNIDQAFSGSENTSDIIPIKETIEHENYETNYYHNDIAIVVLSRPIRFTQFIGPACVPNYQRNIVNEWVKIIGWGKITFKSKKINGQTIIGVYEDISTSVLMEADFKVVDNKICNKQHIKEVLTDKRIQICSFSRTKDICQGDSGGPVIWLDPEINSYTLVGIVSYSTNQCVGRKPNVNTDVGHYIPWIRTKISGTGLPGDLCYKI